jgi:hypothetical protein
MQAISDRENQISTTTCASLQRKREFGRAACVGLNSQSVMVGVTHMF